VVFTGAVQGGWSRRALLIAAVGAAGSALTGCSWRDGDPPPPEPDPLAPLLAATEELAARYEAVRAARPELADRLAAIHQTHLAHVDALRELIGAAPSSPPPSPTPPPVGDPATVLAELRDRERVAQTEAAAACLSAPSTRVALLGSIAAARATHVVVLSR